MSQFENELHLIEALIRQGQQAEARARLGVLKSQRIKRSQRLKLAELSRRVGMPMQALRLLYRAVRPKQGLPIADAAESIEYAAALIQIGSIGEARDLLAPLVLTGNPMALFYLAFAKIADWDYASAQQLLKQASVGFQADPYRQLLCQINLAVCDIVADQPKQALKTADLIETQAAQMNYGILLNHCLEIRIQALLALRDFGHSKQLLLRATDPENSPTPNRSNLRGHYFEKWSGVLALLAKDFGKARTQFLLARKLSAQVNDFESLRDIDLHLGLCPDHKHWLWNAYFGSSSPFFRTRVLKSADLTKEAVPLHHVWSEGLPAEVFTWERLSRLATECKSGRILHRLFVELTADQYKPQGVGQIWTSLYPDQLFDPFSSLHRVHSNIHRLRLILETHSKLQLKQVRIGYKIMIPEQWGLGKSAQDQVAMDANQFSLELLENSFSERFTAEVAAHALKISQPSFSRLIATSHPQLSIVRERQGRTVFYRVVRASKMRAHG